MNILVCSVCSLKLRVSVVTKVGMTLSVSLCFDMVGVRKQMTEGCVFVDMLTDLIAWLLTLIVVWNGG